MADEASGRMTPDVGSRNVDDLRRSSGDGAHIGGGRMLDVDALLARLLSVKGAV